jgi:type III secretion system YscD/HrpQ family protein
MIKQNIQYVVKVLSGANQGATADLQVGSGVIIGRSNSCDIIFNGANVADRHIAIELEGEKLRLTPLAQPVYIDGKDVGSHEVILYPNQLVNIGVVDFTIADKNQPWPDYDKNTKKIDVVKRLGHNNKVTTKPSLFGSPWLWLAAIIMLLANIHYLTRDYGGILGLIGLEKTTSQKISSVINVDSYPALYVKKLGNGVTEIRGYVSNSHQKASVTKQINEIGGDVVSTIFVDDEIEKSAKQISQSLGETGIDFSTIEHGRLKASGMAESRSKWMNIKENIRSDVRGVTSVNDDEVRNLNELFLVLERKVKQQSFSKRVTLELRKGTIVAKGKLTESERKQWNLVKESFLKNSFYPFKFREIFRTPDADIKLSIRSVSVGDIPFVVSMDGDKYFQGSHVGSGYYIKSITDDFILLKNNNIEFPVYFGQKKGKH